MYCVTWTAQCLVLHGQHNVAAEIALTTDVKSEILFFSLVLY
jgi:hypothetical protein